MPEINGILLVGDKSARTYVSASADKREKPEEREIVSVFITFPVSDNGFLDNTPQTTPARLAYTSGKEFSLKLIRYFSRRHFSYLLSFWFTATLLFLSAT